MSRLRKKWGLARGRATAVWKRDRAPFLVFGLGFLYAAVFAQGIPLWDDDFTSWFWKIKDRSIFRYVWEWLWPVSTQPQYWGFNERPAQAFIYRFFHAISGYESWSYFLFKDVVYGLLGVTIYAWVRELGGARLAAAAAAALFLTAPNPMAAHFLHSDLAPLAELLFGALLLWAFRAVEATPAGWRGFPSPHLEEQKNWLVGWLVLSFCVYLSYKTKGDTRAIPMILALYVLMVRPHQWAYFAVPVGMMVLLAVPWGPGLFSKLPPWMPGSKGSEIGWMYQPASAGRTIDFVIPREILELSRPFTFVPLSLVGILGPILVFPLLGYLARREFAAPDGVTLFPAPDKRARGVIFVLIWAAAALAVVSALPELNWVFRVRYGIITLLPVTILVGLLIDRFIAERRMPRWVMITGAVLLATQLAVNISRSAKHRHDLGSVMVAVDRVYGEVASKYPDWMLTMLPDFRPYDYRPGAAKAIDGRKWLGSAAELKQYAPERTLVISWSPQFGGEFEFLGRFEGCRRWVVFDWIYPCERGSGANLMRYVGEQPELARAEELKAKGRIGEAAELLAGIVRKYPGHLRARFLLGLIAYEARDAKGMQEVFGSLELAAPKDHRVLFNHGLALLELGRAEEAIERLEKVTVADPSNSAAREHLNRARDLLRSK